MPKGYYGLSHFKDSVPGRAAVVLVNLGTPDAPTASAVRRYLAEFLADPRVIEMPRWLWWLILNGVILRLRPRRSAANYAQIWTEQGSPLLVNSQRLALQLELRLRELSCGPVQVEAAMCYGNPGLPEVVRRLHDRGVRRLLLLPLYPQYSGTSTGAVIDAMADCLKSLRWPPELRLINDYHDEPGFVEALARRVEAHWTVHGRADRLLLSFHGIPQRYVAAGDPYQLHCEATARLLTTRLGPEAPQIDLVYQSRVGREVWLKPYTDVYLRQLPGQGVRSVQVMCPGFAVDCLETLQEIAMENRETFLAAGGQRFDYIPALNDDASHVEALAALLLRHGQGWTEFCAVADSSTKQNAALIGVGRAAD